MRQNFLLETSTSEIKTVLIVILLPANERGACGDYGGSDKSLVFASFFDFWSSADVIGLYLVATMTNNEELPRSKQHVFNIYALLHWNIAHNVLILEV